MQKDAEENKNAEIEMNLKMKRDGKNWRKKCADEEKYFPILCECVER